MTSGLNISAILIAYLCCSLNIFLFTVNSPRFIISFSPANLCKKRHSLLVHSIPFKKYEQYFVVPKLALIIWLSIILSSKLNMAIDASYGLEYVTYAE